MLKKIILSVVFLLLFGFTFTSVIDAQIKKIPFTPPPKNLPQYAPDQLVIVYKEGQSPLQIEQKIAQTKKETSSFLGRLTYQIQVLTGQQKPFSYYEQKLTSLEVKLKDSGVVKDQSINNPWGTTTSKVTLKKGTDLNQAIKELKKLPEVQSVEFNYYVYPSKISQEFSSNKFVIQYKEGSTPPELEEEVDDRAKISSSAFGQVRIAAENLGTVILGEDSPEVKLERLDTVADEVGQIAEKPLIPENIEIPQPLENTFVLTTDGRADTNEVLVKYASLPEVENIRPVGKIIPYKTPNDQFYTQMWNLPKINAPTAWDKTTGSSGVIVAVVDTGVDYNHPDLKDHVVKGKDFQNNDNDPIDDVGHGTHVSGTIGAMTNNSIGVSGINWDIKILAIKVLGYSGGEDSILSQAIAYAADNGAKVINMSLGGEAPTPCPFDIQQAIDYAGGKGVTIVVAAGNSSQNAGSYFPANCSGVITVGATTPSDTQAGFSNFGPSVSISAPGTDIPSTFSNNQYSAMSGTSMASPHVAGAAALLLSLDSSLTPDQVKNLLVSNADSIPGSVIGPRLNLSKAVDAVSGSGPTATPTPTGTGGTTPSPTPSNLTNCSVPENDLVLTSEEQQVISLVNDYRKQNGLNELTPSLNLTRAASWMANDLVSHGGLSHTDSLGRGAEKRFPDCGYNGSGAENLAGGSLDAQGVFDGWKSSPGHNANMLNGSFKTIGIARAGGGSNTVWVQTFGTDLDSQQPPTGNPTPSPSLTPSPTPTGTVIQNPSTTPTQAPEKGTKVSIKIPGIGSSPGDNSSPIDKERSVAIQFIGENGVVKKTSEGRVKLENGMFTGVLPVPDLEPGSYQIKVNFSDGGPTLDKLIPGFFEFPVNNVITFPNVTITTGDVNRDKILDILDYNVIISCIGKCDNTVVDLNDDSRVDAKDLNIFLRQLDNRRGD